MPQPTSRTRLPALSPPCTRASAPQLVAGGDEVAVAREAAQPPRRDEPVCAAAGAIAEVERPQAQGGQRAGEHGRQHRKRMGPY